MLFTDGIEKSLNDRNLPIVTLYDFFVLGRNLFHEGKLNGEPLKRLPRDWDLKRAKNALGRLEARRVITPDSDFRSGVWRVIESTRSGSAEEVACIADPFAYVSHLSAMQRYGLTDRSPQALHLTTPKRSLWNALRDERARRDLSGLGDIEKSVLNRSGFKETIRRRPIVVHASAQPWVPTSVSGEETRITSIGQTFADMLTNPSLCGGMRHVLDVWEQEAEPWMAEIINAIGQMESKIVKVRAGFILSELIGLDHPALQQWEQFAQRGGSRKLDPDANYASAFSERWMISINV